MAYKLVCFDVDGTLIENVKFSWQLFHDYFEIDQKRREEGRKAFERGDLTYEQWAEHDVELWKERKVTKQDFSDAIAHHQAKLVRGARETLGELKGHRMKLAVSISCLITRGCSMTSISADSSSTRKGSSPESMRRNTTMSTRRPR